MKPPNMHWENCLYLSLIHIYPSGDATPSKDDFYITEKIKKSSEIMNIDFLDHIIIGDQFYSMRETCFL